MTDPTVHIILCNGATCINSPADAKDCITLAYRDGMGIPANINLGLPDFLRNVVHLPDRVLDLLEIAAYVYCADRSVRRGERDALEFHAWARSFHFFIRVRDHDFWQRPDVCDGLRQLLTFLSGDHEYRFTFQSGHSTPAAHLFDNQEFVLGTPNNAEIILLSGGVDSMTGVLERLSTTNNHLYLISHRSLPSTSRTQDQLVTALNLMFPGRLDHYRFRCSRKSLNERRAKEETQRTRFFLYTSIAYALAHALGQHCVHAFENGVTSLNIAKQESLNEARASRTTHPKTVHHLNRFFSLVADRHFTVHTPYFWLTKTDTMARLAKYGGKGLYTSSVSCSTTFTLERNHTHCGVCSQCVDRRFAAHGAGLGDFDDAVTYAQDFIQNPVTDGAARTTLVDFVRQADLFAKCGCDRFLTDFLNPLADATDYVGLSDDMEAAQRIWELCRRHGEQVMQAARDIRHRREDLGRVPPSGSLLDVLNQREHLKPPVPHVQSDQTGTETTMITPDLLNTLSAIGDNHDNLRRLVEQLQSNGRSNLLPFVGAGLSIPFGFASWRNFLLDQARKGGIEPQITERLDAGEYEEAAQDLLDKRRFRAFHDAIGNEYGEHKLEGKVLTGAVVMLTKLASGPVITTNFDPVLEKVFERANIPFNDMVWGARHADLATEALSRSGRILVKLHGDCRDSHDRILTKSDYDRAYSNGDGSGIDFSKPLPKLLQQLLTGRILLFVGCSLQDDRTVTVLEQVAVNFRSIAHYAILMQPSTQDEQYERDSFLSEHNIRPIWYPNGHHEYIELILAYLADKANP